MPLAGNFLRSESVARGEGNSKSQNARPTCTGLLLIMFCHDFPANSADAGFKTQSADNLFQQ